MCVALVSRSWYVRNTKVDRVEGEAVITTPKYHVNLRRKLRECSKCKREEDVDCYLMARPESKIIHAVVMKFGSMGSYFGDTLFGGGMTVMCGQKAEGDALMSPEPMPVRHVNCKLCKAAIRREQKDA